MATCVLPCVECENLALGDSARFYAPVVVNEARTGLEEGRDLRRVEDVRCLLKNQPAPDLGWAFLPGGHLVVVVKGERSSMDVHVGRFPGGTQRRNVVTKTENRTLQTLHGHLSKAMEF